MCAGGVLGSARARAVGGAAPARRWCPRHAARAERRHNVLPILADALTPEAYAGTVGRVDLVYQDISQRDQVEILSRNLRFLDPDGTVVLMVKSRSIDVAREPDKVYREVESALRKKGLHVLGTVPLDPLQRDHAAVVAEFSRP